MEKDSKKNLLFLALAGVVLVAVNAAVLTAASHGRVAPIGNVALWGTCAGLTTLSLIWSVGLLGLQPMVVAVAYVAGGVLAYQGVKLLPGVNAAELATTGATYGAFGALVVGNATAKVRLAFFRKGQIPFVFVILTLLAVDGILNSCVSNPGWGVMLNTLVLPFMLAGVLTGLIWLLLARIGLAHGISRTTAKAIDEGRSEPVADEVADDDTVMKLMITVPGNGEIDDEPEQGIATAMEAAEPERVVETATTPRAVSAAVPAHADTDLFFPLEIDKDDAFVPPLEPEAFLALEYESLPSGPDEPIVCSEPLVQPPEKKESADDWLSSHLDLLNKINKQK